MSKKSYKRKIEEKYNKKYRKKVAELQAMKREIQLHQAESKWNEVEDELRTVSGFVVVDGKTRYFSVRYHIPTDFVDPCDVFLRTAMPSISIDGVEVLSGHLAVWKRYISNDEVKAQYEASTFDGDG